uniref:ER membrane protein complex subunit 4 n=1 Tax=Asterionellopsis glacialis TaxID=33640 RepID=A0A7S0KX01_9STRA|mmetsp:Transcript_1173/g.1632  ORF Transcript_1173/g.1632 Transcript_1173/m.1632 type:complete len:178 (+) Transcript_1173:196-729(+)
MTGVDLVLKEGNVGYDTILKCPPPVGMKALHSQEKQSTSSSSSFVTTTQKQKDALAAKKKNRAFTIATGPGKQIAMNAFMMYMSGKSLNIFSISITSMAVLTPLSSILSIQKAFSALEDIDLQVPKLIYVACNLVWLGLGLYKMSSMRLLPTTSADWTGSIVWKEMMESSSIPPVMM